MYSLPFNFIGNGDRYTSFTNVEAYIIPADNNVEQALEHTLLVQLVETWLKDEKEMNRKLFVLRYWYGESLGELAERFHLAEGKVADRLYRMRSRLKKYLEGEGVSV